MGTETRALILQVARDLFIRHGYTATSMREVAEQAGIGKATIYHHFPDKLAVMAALLDGNLAFMDAALKAIEAETDPRGRFRTAAAHAARFLFESADIVQIVRREVPDGRARQKAGLFGFFAKFIELLAEAIRGGIEQGIFRPVEPSEAARVFMTMIQGTFAMTFLSGERTPSPDKVASTILDVFFQGIDAR